MFSILYNLFEDSLVESYNLFRNRQIQWVVEGSIWYNLIHLTTLGIAVISLAILVTRFFSQIRNNMVTFSTSAIYHICVSFMALCVTALRISHDVNTNYATHPDLDFILRAEADVAFEFNFDGIDDDGVDTQNVHDTVLGQYLVEIINQLRSEKPMTPLQVKQACDQLRQYLILSSDPHAGDALEVLDTMIHINTTHSRTHQTETEILTLVWQYINDPVRSSYATEFKQALLTQLADCRDHGHIECAVGRMTRVLQTLECTDAPTDLHLKVTWMVNEEIGYYCTKYLEKLRVRVPVECCLALDTLERTPDQQKLVANFYQCLKNNLQRKFRAVYIDSHLLTEKQLDQMVQVYYDQFD